MLKELKTSQLLEYKKLLTTVLDGIDSAVKIRQGLIEYDSVSKYEYAKYDSLNDPEPYYHLKLFDKAIGIVRLYNKREWTIDDDESKYFHFAIRCYNFHFTSYSNLTIKRTSEYTQVSEWLSIEDCIPYFYELCKKMFVEVFKINCNLFEEAIF